jgi:hypothetical protein
MNRQLVLGWVWSVCFSMLLPCFTGAAATTESNLAKVFPVQLGGQLLVEADRGSIEILSASAAEVRVEVLRTVRDETAARAAELFAAHEITLEQNDGVVEVRAKRKKGILRGLERDLQHLEVHYKIWTPGKFNFDLTTSAGAISCAAIEGNMKARTAGGSIRLGAVRGTVDATTSAGSIHLESATGPATIKTAGGSIRLGELASDSTAETSAGSISVSTARGKLKARTSGGSIEIGEVAAPADVRTSAGSITVKLAGAPLEARTSGGSIHVKEARDSVVAETSAGSVSVSFAAQPRADSRLTTSGGGISVGIREGLGFELEAAATGGRVKTEIPVQTVLVGEHRSSHLHGKINEGGPKLTLRTSAGSISIKKL